MSVALRMALAALSASLGELPKNKTAWTHTIFGFDQSPYLTRTLLPRIGARRLMLHRIWRPDFDDHPHNHPWDRASFRILTGGYTEERLVNGRVVKRVLFAGDVNRLDQHTFHRIVDLQPNTWTLGLIGERVQDWGFLVDDELVPHAEYFKRKNHIGIGGPS